MMTVTDAPGRFWQGAIWLRGDTVMNKIAIALALAFAFTTGMALVTVIAHTDQAGAQISDQL